MLGENGKQGESGSVSDRLTSPLPSLRVDLSGAYECVSSSIERSTWLRFGIRASCLSLINNYADISAVSLKLIEMLSDDCSRVTCIFIDPFFYIYSALMQRSQRAHLILIFFSLLSVFL